MERLGTLEPQETETAGLVIRTASPEDAAQACALLMRTITHCCMKDHQNDSRNLSAWLGNKTPDTVASWISTPENYAVVAQSGDTIAGIALLTRLGKLALLYVAPEHEKKGIGRRLLHALETEAQRIGIGLLQVNSTGSASSFYLRHGFSYTGKHKTRFGTTLIRLIKQASAQAKTGRRVVLCRCEQSSLDQVSGQSL